MPRVAPIPWDELPEAERQRLIEGQASGATTNVLPGQITAYAWHDKVPDDGDRHPNYPTHLLGGRLLEFLRIRSAQLGGCGPCMRSRKAGGVTDEDAACLASPAMIEGVTEREKLALEFLDRLATDHWSIDDDMYRRLAAHFTTAEIIELGTTCGGMIGIHRFMHTLDILGDAPPVIGYDPAQIGKRWDELHPDPVQAEAAE